MIAPYKLDDAMETICILTDTREQKNKHILNALDARGIAHRSQKLDYGDYSAECTVDGETISLAKVVVVERKNGLDELAGNITRGRERFAREFERAAKDGAKMYLMVERGSWDDIVHHEYKSQMPHNAYLNTLFSWQQKYNITISFVSKQFAEAYVYGTLFMALKNYLLHGGD